MKNLKLFALALFALSLAGCFASRALGKSLSSLGSAPAKVENKVVDPVRKDARLAVLWVGHATALVQIDDKLILTDPVFVSSVGQLSIRLVEPGLDADRLPMLDAVLVSHMHFDHLSLGTIEMIAPKIRQLLMPRGGIAYLTDFGFPALELDTWTSWEKDGLRVTAVPIAHVGFRYGVDAAWATKSFTGYVVEYHGISVYFPGDTAYDGRAFAQTRIRFPNLDLALLPIAPINPRSLMRGWHTDPAEAVQAFEDLGAKRMVPVHYGTLINSGDEPGDALRLLRDAMREHGLTDQEVGILRIGEQRVLIPK